MLVETFGNGTPKHVFYMYKSINIDGIKIAMNIVTYELISYPTTRIMPSRGSNQHTGVIPIIRMDPATFQAVVTAAVIAIMAPLSANNTNRNGNGVDNPNYGDNQGHQQVCSCNDTPNYEPENSHGNGRVLPKKRK